jgi:hypothetical protein
MPVGKHVLGIGVNFLQNKIEMSTEASISLSVEHVQT